MGATLGAESCGASVVELSILVRDCAGEELVEAISEDIKFSVPVICVWCIGLCDSSVLR